MDCSWIKEIDIKLLEEEHQEICSLIGIEGFIKLYEKFNRVQIYLSTKSLSRLKKIYIHKNSHIHARTLARKLESSQRFVYSVLDDPPPKELLQNNK